MTSELGLDASTSENIQTAATKVSNMLYLPSGVRLFRLPRQLGKLEFRIDFFFPLLYSYYKKSGSTPLPNELKIVDTIVLKG